MEGNVKWFNTEKGYGFIKGDDDEEYFVHHKAVAEGLALNENDRVSFDPVDTERGKQAQNVKAAEEGAAEAPAEEAPAEAEPEEQAE